MTFAIANIMNAADTYRVEALLELAASFPQSLTAAAIAERRGVPRPFLARLLRALAADGVVRTARGVSGGVRLARRPDEVALAAVLGGTALRPGARGGPGVAFIADRLARARHEALASLSLAGLLEVERKAAGSADWQI